MHFVEFKDFIENSYIHIKDLHHFMLAPSLSSTGEEFSKCIGTTSLVFVKDLVWHYHEWTLTFPFSI